ncbi:hypothetical protein KFL_000370360 [Klebsormidium nitens]|uniref:Uncharacterized protein n=1 Tax=Klebsormidium nitens TaxID=105231 RepID=A0A1Y1HPR4_KLENI|nr:hypothetical protein KFL_000370360 [Klebsormidium nitens]|eukprot:GAQ79762.1 hypothetical protein KFL_000370360 [Klebsormidium nitens]
MLLPDWIAAIGSTEPPPDHHLFKLLQESLCGSSRAVGLQSSPQARQQRLSESDDSRERCIVQDSAPGPNPPPDGPPPPLKEFVFSWQSTISDQSPLSIPPVQRPKAVPELGLFVFDDGLTVFVVDTRRAKATLTWQVSAQSLLQGWEVFDAHLYVVDGTVLSRYDLLAEKPTTVATLDLYDGPASESQRLNAALHAAWQGRQWVSLLYWLYSEAVGISESLPRPQIDLVAGFKKYFLTIAPKLPKDYVFSLPMVPNPSLPAPVPVITREQLTGDRTCQLFLALLDVLQVLGMPYRSGVDPPTVCAYMKDHPEEAINLLWCCREGYLGLGVNAFDAKSRELDDLLAGNALRFSAPVFSSTDRGLFVLCSNGSVLNIEWDTGGMPAAMGVVRRYPSVTTQAVVRSGLVLCDPAAALFFLSEDKGLCSVSLRGAAPQNFPPPQAPDPATFQYQWDSAYTSLQRMPPVFSVSRQVWASLPALYAFQIPDGGDAPFSAPLWQPLPGDRFTSVEVDEDSGTLLIVNSSGSASSYSLNVPPGSALRLVGQTTTTFNNAIEPGRYPLPACSAALIKPVASSANGAASPPKLLLVETDSQYGSASGTAFAVASRLSEPGGPFQDGDVTRLGTIPGIAFSAPIGFYNEQTDQPQAVVAWGSGPPSQLLDELAPAPGAQSLASSAWSRAIVGKSPAELMASAPPIGLGLRPGLTSIPL